MLTFWNAGSFMTGARERIQYSCLRDLVGLAQYMGTNIIGIRTYCCEADLS